MKKAAAALLLIGLLVGCNDSKPSDSDIVGAINDEFAREGGAGLMEVVNLQKINGYEKPGGGYVARLSYQIRINKSYQEVRRLKEVPPALSGAVSMLEIGSFFGGGKGGSVGWEAGTLLDREEKEIVLQRGERGWLIGGK